MVDGVLVALAYFLAFWLRFEGPPKGPYGQLLDQTIGWAVVVALVALAGFGQYQRLWRFVGQRDYEAVLKAVIVATVVLVGAIALIHPVDRSVTDAPGVRPRAPSPAALHFRRSCPRTRPR